MKKVLTDFTSGDNYYVSSYNNSILTLQSNNKYVDKCKAVSLKLSGHGGGFRNPSLNMALFPEVVILPAVR